MFQDFNFKLAVINELMYNQGVLKPMFDRHKFCEEHHIDLHNGSYDYKMIPEVRAYFEALEIPTDLLSTITSIEQDGGDEIYFQVCSMWDGEDDLFTITSTADCALLPNLQRVVLLYDDAELMVSAFEEIGIEAEYV